jgi:hypothetical protein
MSIESRWVSKQLPRNAGELRTSGLPAALEIEQLRSEVASLKDRIAVKCEHPNVAQCAKLWEADTFRRQLEWVSKELAAEFPFGCDTVEHLATALLEAREIVARIPTTADCVHVVPGIDRVWHPDFQGSGTPKDDRFAYWACYNRKISECYSTKAAMEAARKVGT